MLKNRKLVTEYKPPSLKFEPQIDAKVEAHTQIGFTVEFEEQYLALCFGSFVCAEVRNPSSRKTFTREATPFASYSNQGTYNECLLEAKFADSFEYSDEYKAKRCGKTGGLSYGFGAYFQVPKTQIESKLLIELSEACPTCSHRQSSRRFRTRTIQIQTFSSQSFDCICAFHAKRGSARRVCASCL